MKKDNKDTVREVIVEKKSGFNTFEVLVIVVVSILFGVVVGNIISNTTKSVSGVKMSPELQEFVSTYDNILDNYYDNVSEKELVDAAIKGMIESLDDPYSLYMNGKDAESFNQIIDGSYVGIGVTVTNKDNRNYILDIFKNSPAQKGGLKIGDIFVKVDGKDVSSMKIDGLTKLIKGKRGTKVDITVLRGKEKVTKTIVRDNVSIPSVTSKIINKNNKKIGYIYISSFAANTYKQFNKELNKLEKKKIDSLIIDVRSNPGGHLNQVTSILEEFMNKKKVLYQIDSKGKKTKIYSTTSEKRKYKIAVLINQGSASASELLAAAFKESYDNSVIVGEKSYGKGTVQKAYRLSNGSSLKYTTEKWLSPKGNWIDKKGIEPTHVVKLSDKYKDNPTDENDNQLQKAIELLIK